MNKCPVCGTYIPEGGRVCLSCGWQPEGGDAVDPIFRYMQDAFNKASSNMNETDSMTGEYREQELAAAGYIGPVFIYSLIKCRDSELVKYHAKQAGLLLLAHIMNEAVGVLPGLGKPLKKINTAVLIVLAFLGARNAYFNKKEPVPIVSKLISQLFR